MKDLIDILLDENNTDPIVVIDEKGRQIAFEQIAIIPRDETIYCVLKPIDEINGVADDEGIVFKVDKNEAGESILRVETDELIAMEIFDQYYDLIDENRKKSANDSNQNGNFSDLIDQFRKDNANKNRSDD